jgi:creatinine amidohydrolase
MLKLFLTSLALFFLALTQDSTAYAAAPKAYVFLEDFTSTELRDAISAGKTTIIIPIGGTEQNGPHMALGKHNVRGKVLAEKIAVQLGNAVIAPMLAYVPEGNLSPPTSHMRWTGTITVSDSAFKGILEGAAQSFKAHGFTDVVFIGEHGGYQTLVKELAMKLNTTWKKDGKARAHFIAEYYRVTQTAYAQALKANGITDKQIGVHAGAADTSLMLATDESLVRRDRFAQALKEGVAGGVTGDPTPSTATLGQLGVQIIVEQTVKAIRAATAAR